MKKIKIYLDNLEVSCLEGEKLSKVILRQDIKLAVPCNGKGRCGKCKVTLLNNITEPTTQERHLLTETELSNNIRLACLVTATDGMKITNIFQDDSNSLKVTLGNITVPVAAPLFQRYGVAIDIGTTTMAATLYDTEQLLASASGKNPQCKMGADVISRIEASLSGKGLELQSLVVKKINKLIAKMVKYTHITTEDIDYCVITGNTTMLYLLNNKDVFSLSQAPFIADELYGLELLSSDLGIQLSRDAKVFLPRCISSFVGADITTAILASHMTDSLRNSLLLDIGTNGEIAFFDGTSLHCSATAAGPAFEGGELSCGTQGIDGAIHSVFWKNGKFEVETISDKTAVGICGTGVIDLLSVLKNIEAMDETGALDEDILEALNIAITIDDDTAVKLTDTVYFTQADIRKVQLAKGAIAAGVRTVLGDNNLSYDTIDTFYLAGGFGKHMDLNSAANIGLIPTELVEKATIVGNAALDGASLILCNNQTKNFLIKDSISAVGKDLSLNPKFVEHYMDCMEF